MPAGRWRLWRSIIRTRDPCASRKSPQRSDPVELSRADLIELKSKGLIQSRRGKAGGYMLAKTPKEITVGDVLRAIRATFGDAVVG